MEKLEKSLNQKGLVGDFFKVLEENTGIQRLYIAYGFGAIIILWLVFGFGGQLVTNTIAFAYPAYSSIKALESTVKSDDTQWLTYWVVFAFFSVIEYFADFIAGWIPFYWLTKCLFMVWCMAPIDSNGSAIIYNKVILPFFLKHQTDIDEAMSLAQGTAGDLLGDAMDMAGTKAGDILGIMTEKAKDLAAEHQLNKNKDE